MVNENYYDNANGIIKGKTILIDFVDKVDISFFDTSIEFENENYSILINV